MALTKITMTGDKDLIKEGFDKVNDIIDDLASTSTGLGASCIGIKDTAGNLDATNVETAIAEVYSDTESTRNLSEVFNANPATTTGLTWGYKAGVIRVDNVVTDVAAATVSLANNAVNYVEISNVGVVSRNTSGFTSGKIPIRQITVASGVQTVSTDKRAWFQTETYSTSTVSQGGTGLTTITDHGLLLGSGTSAVTPLAAATNGQLPIGSTGADPVLATLTATANETTVANAAGTITIGIADDVIVPTSITIPNSGLHVLDTNASHDLIITPGSNLTADRILTLITGDAARTLTISATGTVMIGDGGTTKAYFYQNTAPTGWTIDNTPADSLLAIKGGAQAYNAAGGTQVGTWTQLNHTHTGPSHSHTGPSHSHTISSYAVGYGAGGTEGMHLNNGVTSTGADGTGATGADGTGATGNGASANTWRPLAQLGLIATLDA